MIKKLVSLQKISYLSQRLVLIFICCGMHMLCVFWCALFWSIPIEQTCSGVCVCVCMLVCTCACMCSCVCMPVCVCVCGGGTSVWIYVCHDVA